MQNHGCELYNDNGYATTFKAMVLRRSWLTQKSFVRWSRRGDMINILLFLLYNRHGLRFYTMSLILWGKIFIVFWF